MIYFKIRDDGPILERPCYDCGFLYKLPGKIVETAVKQEVKAESLVDRTGTVSTVVGETETQVTPEFVRRELLKAESWTKFGKSFDFLTSFVLKYVRSVFWPEPPLAAQGRWPSPFMLDADAELYPCVSTSPVLQVKRR